MIYDIMNPFIPYYPMQNSYRQLPTGENTYVKNLLIDLIGQRVDILLNGREGIFKSLLVLKVKDEAIITEAEKEICVIPLKFIAIIFLAKDLAKMIIHI